MKSTINCNFLYIKYIVNDGKSFYNFTVKKERDKWLKHTWTIPFFKFHTQTVKSVRNTPKLLHFSLKKTPLCWLDQNVCVHTLLRVCSLFFRPHDFFFLKKKINIKNTPKLYNCLTFLPKLLGGWEIHLNYLS